MKKKLKNKVPTNLVNIQPSRKFSPKVECEIKHINVIDHTQA